VSRADLQSQADQLEARLTDEQRADLDAAADWLTTRRLGTFAVMTLEMFVPMNFLFASLLHGIQPFLEMLRGKDPARYRRFATLMEERGAFELLMRRLEARA
jgi:hypothetical protein